ncbi:hypothetical protein BJY00DRAFT_283637 [Aspergillus carlsbadensis]|nr:hypothetical protein BJY00DRAFT_283637 [Aspergillus carlsbadensis]
MDDESLPILRMWCSACVSSLSVFLGCGDESMAQRVCVSYGRKEVLCCMRSWI